MHCNSFALKLRTFQASEMKKYSYPIWSDYQPSPTLVVQDEGLLSVFDSSKHHLDRFSILCMYLNFALCATPIQNNTATGMQLVLIGISPTKRLRT